MNAGTLFLLLAMGACADTLQESRWKAATLEPRCAHEAGQIVLRVMAAKTRYDAVAKATGVPFYVTAGLNQMESGGSFQCHLYEGSPLTGRTRFVPKGQPISGNPPFPWEASAIGALRLEHMDQVDWSRLDDTLYACERYNGLGYLQNHPATPTPYLWAGTRIERRGKYVADGKWSSTARSSQIGVAAIWKRLEAAGVCDFSKLK